MKHQLVIGVYYSHKVEWLFDGFDRFSWHFKNISKNIYIQASPSLVHHILCGNVCLALRLDPS